MLLKSSTVQLLATFLLAACMAAFAAPSVEAQDFAPFFDEEEETPVDPAPAPPEITPFGEAVLTLCGGWGAPVPRTAFAQLMERAPETLRIRLKALGLQGKVGEDEAGESALERAWFDARGFRHIFCGEPKHRKLGGLHYHGRYLQMQREGWGGLDRSCHRMEIADPVYTLGLFYRRPDGTRGRACVKGYSLDLTAEALFWHVTRAWQMVQAAEPEGATDNRACLYPIPSPDGEEGRYNAIFVHRQGAIVTFYPLAGKSRRELPFC